jgi:hypothetical protein
MKARLLGVGMLLLGAAFIALPSNASTIDWTLTNVTFNDGGTASGTFESDSTTGFVTAFDITTAAGSTLGGFVYDSATVFDNVDISTQLYVLTDSSYLRLAFMNPLTSAGVDLIDATGGISYECLACSPFRLVTGGEALGVNTTPLPAALPLFATGLGVLGWLGRRRKRKRAVTTATA